MKAIPVSLLLLVVVGVVSGQPDQGRIYSTPDLPSAEALDRLNMKMAWTAFAPTEGRRDGIISLQIAPLLIDGEYKFRLLVQTYTGSIAEIDAETGKTYWRARAGNPNTTAYGLGFNANVVAAVRGPEIYGFSRRDGGQLWRLVLASAPACTPLMDRDNLFLNLAAERVESYKLPVEPGAAPKRFRDHRSSVSLELEPRQSDDFLMYPSATGTVSVLNKNSLGLYVRFKSVGALSAGPGVHESFSCVYLGSRDGNVYGFPLKGDHSEWRFTTGTAVERTPFVNDKDVYATANRKGLFRIQRRSLEPTALGELLVQTGLATRKQIEEVIGESKGTADLAAFMLSQLWKKGYITGTQKANLRWRAGESVWQNTEADRVAAVNDKFVYAMDAAGRMLVIDRERGRTLSRYDLTRDYPVAVSNEWTDRVYLAANNGLIVCLHDRSYLKRKEMKTLPALAPPKDPKDPPKDK